MSPQPIPQDSSAHAAPAPVAAEAREWIAWLAAGRLDEERMQAFERWLAGPGHRRAFEHERVVWRSLGPRPTVQPGCAAPRRATRVRRHWIAAAAVAALAMVLAAPDLWLHARADHISRHAVEVVALPDGSEAILDADSAIAVHYGADTRRIALLRGRAWFSVAAAPGRPFLVEANGGVVEDISTAFAVSTDGDAVEAVVEQGRVRVAASEGSGWTYLQAGQRARYASSGPGVAGVVSRLDDVSVDRAVAWRRGELLLDAADVAQAVEAIGRYRSGPTFILGDLTGLPAINAAFRITQPEQALDALAGSAGLQVRRLPMGVAIVSEAQTPDPAHH